jgi:hypothetical protein
VIRSPQGTSHLGARPEALSSTCLIYVFNGGI